MKNILIVAGAAVVTLYVAKTLFNQSGVNPMRRIDMQGREYIFRENKNGYIQDQYGGMWA